MYALKKYGIEVKDKNELNKFIGPPLGDSFQKYYGFSSEEAKTAIEYYREYYTEKGIFENTLYDGIEALLKRIKDSGGIIILATSKPKIFAKRILKHFGMDRYFSYVIGSNLDGTMVKKYDIIKSAIESCQITDLSKAVMVGDRHYDIDGAKKSGIRSIGVLYGYGSRKELKEAGADFIAGSVEEIWDILIGGK
jgi:phosphoglycolate phosphatase